jgi:hypothetical protein
MRWPLSARRPRGRLHPTQRLSGPPLVTRGTRSLVRDAGSIAAKGAALPAATMATLAERLPVLWGTSTAPWTWQASEFCA